MSECRRIRELIGPCVYDDLPEAERRKVEGHLRACEACRAEAEALRALVARLPATLTDVPAGAEQRVLRGVQRRLAARRPVLPGGLRPVLLAAAALAVGVWIGYQLPRTSRAPAPAGAVQPHPGPGQAETRTVQPEPATVSVATRTTPAPRSHPAAATQPFEVRRGRPRAAAPRPAPPPGAEAAAPPADRTSRAEMTPAPEPPRMGLRTVVIAPRPVGGDDVQLAEVVQMEAIR
jgi:hypothetical protein